MSVETQICSRCRIEKSLCDFNKAGKAKNGRRCECKLCQSECGKTSRESKLPPPKKIESLEGEIWVEIKLHNRPYAVSNMIRIKALQNKWSRNEYLINQRIYTNGYVNIKLGAQYKEKNHTVHRLIAKAFIPNPEKKPCVNHKNGDKADNRIENLEWCTYEENSQHAVLHNLINPPKGVDHSGCRLLEPDIIDIYTSDLSVFELAKKYAYCAGAIRDIRRGKNHSSVTGATYKKRNSEEYDRMVLEVYASNKRKCELIKLYPFSLTTIKNIKSGRTHSSLTNKIQRL